MAVEQRPKFDDVIRQMLRRNTSVFGKWQWFSLPFRIAQQPDGFFTHVIDALYTRQIGANLITNHTAFFVTHQPVETLTQCAHLAFDEISIIAGELNNVKPLHIFAFNIRDVVTHAVPDNILTCQIQHF